MITKSLLPCLAFVIIAFSTFNADAQNRQVSPDMLHQAQSQGIDVGAIDIASDRGSSYATPSADVNRTRAEILDAPVTVAASPVAEDVKILPEALASQKKDREAELRNSVFGREIFSSRNLTFAPNYNMPTPQNYVLGSGDKLIIDVTGSTSANYTPVVSPDGAILIPNAGLIPVAGMTIEAATKRIQERLSSSIEGISSGTSKVNVSLGDVRSIKVNIIGEASLPGTYTLPAISSLFNALYSAGGVNDIGSLRNIRLVRDGKQIAILDIYDYLLHNKQEVNMGLKEGDMIVVSPYENFVKISGNVKRPRIYELLKNQSVNEILNYAGGFVGNSYKGQITVDRKSGLQKSIHTVSADEFETFKLTDGDQLSVGSVINKYDNRVSILGAVWRPGDFELKDSTSSVLRLIEQAKGVRGDAVLSRAQIIRQRPDLTLEVIAFDLGAMLNGTIPDIALQVEDDLRIASIGSLREGQTLSIHGEVNNPGSRLLYRHKMTIQDIIMLSGGLKESASLARIEIARRIKNPNSTEVSNQIAELFEFKIPQDLVIDPATASFELEPFDQVYVRASPGYSAQQSTRISGEVVFPGEYVLSSSTDRLTDLLKKAGGLSPQAYTKGAYLNRRVSADRLARIQTLESLSNRGKSVLGDTVLTSKLQIGDYYPIAIDLMAAILNPNNSENLILQEGDVLVIPKYNSTVTISGAVLFPCVISYKENMKIKDCIVRSGGYANRAKKRPFVIYANGMPMSRKGGRNPMVEPGCEIVVPQKEPKNNSLGAVGATSLATSTISMLAMLTSIFK